MKVLIYLYYPFFDKHLAGGVQVWLRNLLRQLQELDPSIRFSIYCPYSDAHPFPKDLDVHPVLFDLERDFLPLIEVKKTLSFLENAEKNADIIWMIDRCFPIKSSKPKLLSLNTICYEREIMSIFQSEWDCMSVPSEYVRKELCSVLDDVNHVRVIPHCIDKIFTSSHKSVIDTVRKYFDYRPELKYILSPHRPDSSKGHEYAIEILKELISYDTRYRLLIPRSPDAKKANVVSEYEYVDHLKNYALQLGVLENVIFHDWIDYNDLPSYYSIGEYTLFLSKLQETFGLSLLNSVACGTPTISFGTGALAEVVPPGSAHYIIQTPAQAVNLILHNDPQISESDMNFIVKRYNMDNIIHMYYDLLKYTCSLRNSRR